MKQTVIWDEEMQIALRACFYYLPDKGEVGRRFDSKRAKAGPLTAPAPGGGVMTNFLWKGRVWGIRANRLAFFLHTGEQPAEVQFVDYDKNNLKFENLRPIYSREQVLAKHEPVDYQALSYANDPNNSAPPKNVPQPQAAQIVPATQKVAPLKRPPDDLFDELFIHSYNKGNMVYTEHGSLKSKHFGEVLPSNYTFYDKSPDEQARLIEGWKALLYLGNPITPDEKTQEQLDIEAGLTPKYTREQSISRASDVDIPTLKQLVANATQQAAPETDEQDKRWGDV